jgi:LysR family transcriptional regulator, hca operon transcriptional activator
MPDLAFKNFSSKKPLVVILTNDHRLAALKSISPRDLVGEPFVARVGYSTCSACGHRRLPKAVRSRYHASSRGGPPRYGNVPSRFDARRWAVTDLRSELSRFTSNRSSSQGRHTVGRLVLGYKKSNRSPILKLLLSRLDGLIAHHSIHRWVTAHKLAD